jgi:hypothetical protein
MVMGSRIDQRLVVQKCVDVGKLGLASGALHTAAPEIFLIQQEEASLLPANGAEGSAARLSVPPLPVALALILDGLIGAREGFLEALDLFVFLAMHQLRIGQRDFCIGQCVRHVSHL